MFMEGRAQGSGLGFRVYLYPKGLGKWGCGGGIRIITERTYHILPISNDSPQPLMQTNSEPEAQLWEQFSKIGSLLGPFYKSVVLFVGAKKGTLI